jgi:serine/threonine-protein kinase
VNVEQLTQIAPGYTPITLLGRGGSAEAYLAVAESEGHRKFVVLKTLHDEVADDPEVRDALLAEAKLCSQLSHPNIVGFQRIIEGPRPVLVLEYLEGQALGALLARTRNKVTLATQIGIVLEVLQALHYAHDLEVDGTHLGIVHRDISPENVYITYDGHVKVLDFGIAKVAASEHQTQFGVVKGRLEYMAPEQLLGEGVDRRTDLFSVGCLLWDMAVGHSLWQNTSEGELIRALSEGTIPKPSSANPKVDPELEAIIMKALGAEREQRHESAAELYRELSEYLNAHALKPNLTAAGVILAREFADERTLRNESIRNILVPPAKRLRESLNSNVIAAYQRDTTPVHPAQQSPKRSGLVGAVAFALTVPVLVLAAIWVGGSLARQQQSAAAIPAASSAAPKLETVQVSLAATPPTATLWLDSARLDTNPALLVLPKDGSRREVRASCPGCLTQSRIVELKTDNVVEFRLGAAPVPAARPAPAPAPLPAPVRAAPKPEKPAGPDCRVPYHVINGVKSYRPECL